MNSSYIFEPIHKVTKLLFFVLRLFFLNYFTFRLFHFDSNLVCLHLFLLFTFIVFLWYFHRLFYHYPNFHFFINFTIFQHVFVTVLDHFFSTSKSLISPFGIIYQIAFMLLFLCSIDFIVPNSKILSSLCLIAIRLLSIKVVYRAMFYLTYRTTWINNVEY